MGDKKQIPIPYIIFLASTVVDCKFALTMGLTCIMFPASVLAICIGSLRRGVAVFSNHAATIRQRLVE